MKNTDSVRPPQARRRVVATFLITAATFMALGAIALGSHAADVRQMLAGAHPAGATAKASTESSSVAQSPRPKVNLKMTAKITRNGRVMSLEEAGSVRPNDLVTYEVASVNAGDMAAQKFRAVGPVPAGTVLVAGSARDANADITYSIDHGKSFQAQPMIEEVGPDGQKRMVPAPISLYTHVGFSYRSAIEPMGSRAGSYQVSVK